MNVCTAVVLVLVSECAAWIQSFITTSTPRPLALGIDGDAHARCRG